jgi:hypothetical protein
LTILFVVNAFAQQRAEDARWNLHPASTQLVPTGEQTSMPAPTQTIKYTPPTQPRVFYGPRETFVIEPNIRPHPNTTHTQSEVIIVRHPSNQNIMFASSNTVRISPIAIGEGVYVTTDGGTTWGGGDSVLFGSGHSGDPGPTIDKDGRFIISHLGGSTGMSANWSTNNGVTWSANIAIPGGSGADKNFSGTDDAPTSPFYGRSYTVWTNFSGTFANRIVISYSTDGGATWSSAAPVSPPPSSGHHHQGCDIRVGPNGQVYVVWANCTTNGQNSTEDSLGFAMSTDGGVTWAVSTNRAIDMNGIRAGSYFNSIRVSGFPRIDVDRSGGPRNGWIYVTAAEKAPLLPARDQGDITLMRSTDQGATWTKVLVNQDPTAGPRQYMSAIRVDESGGVNIVYYDQRNTTADSAEVWMSRSIDGGVTWTDVQVSDARFRPTPIAGLATGYQGDYIGITSGNGKVWPNWCDNRLGWYQSWVSGIATTENFGWVKGVTVSTDGGAIISGVNVDITNATPFVGATSDALGRFKVGARVDTPGTTRSITFRGRKFGYVDTTRTVTITRGDTLNFGNFALRPAPGGTLTVFSHTATTNLRSFVEVKLGTTVVLTDSTNGTTGLLIVPLPSGTYSVRVDAPPPYITRNFPSVVIGTGTTGLDALTSPVLTFNPTAVRETLSVGGSRTRSFVITNNAADTVGFRISDDNASARMRLAPDPNLPSVKRSVQQQKVVERPKGVENPNPGERFSPNGRGGPDGFGYSWIDSDEPGGPTFNWVDISTNGTLITGLGDDTNVGPFPIGFSFPFYGTAYNQIRFCTNGFLSFTSTSTTFTNTAIPTTVEPNNAIYPFWDDLIFSATNGARAFYRYDTTNSRFIVQYDKVLRFGATTDTVTFQVILRPNGEMLFQYLRMVGTTNSATIGIENATGTVALQVVSDAPYMHNNLAVRIYLPDAPWISENPLQGRIPPAANQSIVCTFDATGLTPGTTYNANIFVDAPHPDHPAGRSTVPASLRVNPASGAAINVSPTVLVFPSTAIGNSRRDSSRVRNVGTATLTLTSVTTTNPRFTAVATSTSIAIGDSARIRVTYTPVVPAGTDTGRVIILSNDATNPRVDIALTGTSVGVPLFRARIDSLVRPAMVANTRDSIRFFVRNIGTTSGNFAAQAIMFPRTSADMVGPAEPVVIPVEISRTQPASVPPTSMADFGPAPRSEQGPIGREPNVTLDAINAIGINLLGTPANALTKFDLATPGTLIPGPITVQSFAGDFDPTTNSILAIRQTAPISFGRIDTATGVFTVIGPTPPGTGETWTAMKIDPTSGTIYATAVTLTTTNIYTINRTTGAPTLVAAANGAPALIGMDFDNTGQMFGYNLNDSLYRINKTTGATTLLGYIGFNCNFAQDMDFDRSTGICYLAAYNNTAPARGELRIANLTTGNTTLVGPLGTTTEMDCFSTLTSGGAFAPWLSVAPTSGTIAINDSVQMTARFDATDPLIYNNPGNYRGEIQITATNSALSDTLRIPVRMFVVPPAGAELTVVPDSVDFGDVPLGRTDSSKTVLLRNIGASTLTITNITSSNPAFSPSVTSRTIASLDTFRLRLRFTSSTPAGVKLGTLSFTSNDPTPPTVRMRGVAVGQADIVVRPDTFYYNRRNTPDTTRSTFFVRNSGTDTLRYTLEEGVPPSEASDRAIERSQQQQHVIELGKGVEHAGPGQPPSIINGRGGPDAFGYIWIDSDEPGGPQFNYVDIRATGTAVTLTDDQNVDLGSLGFNFSFYGNTYTGIRVCSNGFLSFTSTSTTFTNTAIPTTTEPNNALYGFWDDLNPALGGTVHYLRDVANNRFIVQWSNILRFGTTTDTVNFQIIVKANGDILYQYLRMVGVTNSATIGIENATGTTALQVVFNAAYVHNNLAVLLTRDLFPWMSTDRTAGTLAPGDSQAVSLRIHPAGLPGGTLRGHVLARGNTPTIGRVRVRLDLIGDTTITVTRPNGGEIFTGGTTENIVWSQFGVDSVAISYSTTGRGGPYTQIAVVPARPGTWIHPKAAALGIPGTEVDMVDGTYAWTVPNGINSTNCFIRIARRSTGRPADTSDAAFTIRPGGVTNDTSWTVQTSGTTSVLYTTKAVSNLVAWAAGAGGTVRRTTDGGTTWTNANPGGTPIGTADVYAIEAIDANNAWCTTSPGATFIYRTTNGGTTWTQVYTLAAAFINGIQMVNTTTGYAEGDPVGGNWLLLRTTDGGATWTQLTPALPQVGTEAGWNNSFQVRGTYAWFGTNNTKVYYTPNIGTTAFTGSATTGLLNSFAVWFNAASPSGLGMAGGSGGATQRSVNGGGTYTAAAAAGANVTGMGGVSGTEFWATSGTNVFWTSNHGTTWAATPKNGYTGTQALNHVSMVQVGTNVWGWAVGNAGTIVRYRRLATDVASGAGEVPTVYALEQNYPNPFNPYTTIKFSLPEQANVSLKIYNLIGQEVATLAEGEMPAAFHNVVWDGRNSAGAQVATGMYFYRIEATGVSGEKFNSLKKLILLK